MHKPRFMFRPGAAVSVALVAAVLAGCGSSSGSSGSSGPSGSSTAAAASSGGSATSGSGASSTSGDVAYAKAQISKYTPLITHFTAPGPALSGLKSKLEGKTVWYVPDFLQAPIFTANSTDLAQPLALVGAKVHVCNADANPSMASSCINEAVKAHAAGIVVDALNDSFASSAFAAAIAAKIPVVATDNNQPQGFPKTSDLTTVDMGNPLDSRLTADWVIANSDGKADVLYTADNSDDGQIEQAATLDEFKSKCPGCKVTTVTFGDESVNDLPTAVSSAMVKDPSINYVDGNYDAPSGIFALQGAKTVTGRKFTYITGTGQPPGLERVAAGQQVADPGMDPDITMWNTADALFRIIDGKPAVAHQLGVRVFTKANIPSDTKSASAYASGAWYTNGGFKSMYRKLWGGL